ncbi:transposon Ty3-I Gag-Pol polyprotein [Trichonephila clavipes]|nr:transposon Ty3-I Gag-Pol polyprotein [Trichonephila clavipes]
MPFGLSTCPSTFQRFINTVFRDLVVQGIVLPYMDDIVILAKNESEAIERLKKVLQVSSDYGLEINFDKCLTGYFRKFIPAYSVIAKPLSDLLREDTPFNFDVKQKASFDELKRLLCQKPVLGLPRANGQVERINRTIIPVLSKMSEDDPTKWFKHVPSLQEVLNSTFQRSINTTPFELLFGTQINNKTDLRIQQLIDEQLQLEFNENRELLRKAAKTQILKARSALVEFSCPPRWNAPQLEKRSCRILIFLNPVAMWERGRKTGIPHGSFEKDPLTSQIVVLIDFSSTFQKHPYGRQVTNLALLVPFSQLSIESPL